MCLYNKIGDLIKIGHTTKLYERLNNYKIFNPHAELFGLLIREDDHYKLEQSLHKLFDEFNYNGEWFKYKSEIDSYLQTNMDSGDKRMLGIMNKFLRINNTSRSNVLELTMGESKNPKLSSRRHHPTTQPEPNK